MRTLRRTCPGDGDPTDDDPARDAPILWISPNVPAPMPMQLGVAEIRTADQPAELTSRTWELAAPTAIVDLYWPGEEMHDGIDIVNLLGRVAPTTHVVLLVPNDARLRHHLAEATRLVNVKGAVAYGPDLHDRARSAIRSVARDDEFWDSALVLLDEEPDLVLADVLAGSIPLRRAVLSFLVGILSWEQIGREASLGKSRARNTLDDALRRKLRACDPVLAEGPLEQKRFIAWMSEVKPYLYSWARRNYATLDDLERERFDEATAMVTGVREVEANAAQLSSSAS